MPVKAKLSSITHANAIEALRVLSTLASSIPAAQAFAPFTYGDPGPGNTDPHVVAMSPWNSLPAMIVWMFLVTDPRLLQSLDSAVGIPANLVVAGVIATQTNLTLQCVNAILDKYRNAGPLKQSFLDVAQAFQGISPTYPITNCHITAGPIFQLAEQGSAVDPNAPDQSYSREKVQPFPQGSQVK